MEEITPCHLHRRPQAAEEGGLDASRVVEAVAPKGDLSLVTGGGIGGGKGGSSVREGYLRGRYAISGRLHSGYGSWLSFIKAPSKDRSSVPVARDEEFVWVFHPHGVRHHPHCN